MYTLININKYPISFSLSVIPVVTSDKINISPQGIAEIKSRVGSEAPSIRVDSQNVGLAAKRNVIPEGKLGLEPTSPGKVGYKWGGNYQERRVRNRKVSYFGQYRQS